MCILSRNRLTKFWLSTMILRQDLADLDKLRFAKVFSARIRMSTRKQIQLNFLLTGPMNSKQKRQLWSQKEEQKISIYVNQVKNFFLNLTTIIRTILVFLRHSQSQVVIKRKTIEVHYLVLTTARRNKKIKDKKSMFLPE